MTFKTRRLEIRPLSDQDEDAVICLVTDDTVAQTYMLPELKNREAAAAFFQRLKKLSHTEGRYASGVYLGDDLIGILNETHVSDGCIELGYAYLPRYHNQGCATETLQGAIGYFFAQGFEEVVTGAFETNRASIRVMEKCGMRLLERQENIIYRGANHRCVYYAAAHETEQ